MLYGTAFPVSEEALSKDFVLPIGKAKVMREGSDITIVAYSRQVGTSLAAAEELAKEGISAEVINLRSLRPLDIGTIKKSVAKTHRLVAVSEGWLQCGIGSEICALAMEHCFDDLDAPVERLAGADVPMPYAAELELNANPTPPDIVAVCKRVVSRKAYA